jgi:RNA polymerase sigma factor for flagellar operon FliA
MLHPSLVAAAPLRPDAELTGQLWAYYAHSRDADARARLIAAYGPFVRMLAAKMFARRVTTEMEFEDYLQYANVGLLEAVDRFEPGRAVLFETFAASRIAGAMLNGIAQSSEIQRQLAARKSVVSARVASLAEGPGAVGAAKPASSAEAVFARLADLAIGLAVGFVLEGTGMHQDQEGEYADNSYDGVELKQLQVRIAGAVQALGPRQRQVIELHYLQQMEFGDVASELGLTRGRISQLHKEALGMLRTLLKKPDEIDVHF